MMNDDTGSILFSMPSTDPFRYVICAHCEPAVILDKPRVPAVVNVNWTPRCWQRAKGPLEDVRPPK